MFVTFMRCEWRGGSRRLIKAAGMLIGRGHCCPLCSALSYWASVVPVKRPKNWFKICDFNPAHPPTPPPPHSTTHTHPSSVASHSFLSPEENGALFASLISSVSLNQVVGTPLPAVFDPVLGVILSQLFVSHSCGHSDGCTSEPDDFVLRWGRFLSTSSTFVCFYIVLKHWKMWLIDLSLTVKLQNQFGYIDKPS